MGIVLSNSRLVLVYYSDINIPTLFFAMQDQGIHTTSQKHSNFNANQFIR